jgi:hypothetical protein
VATEREHAIGPRVEAFDAIETAIGALVVERQAMRRGGVNSSELEANRLQIACRQQQLSRALIRRHLGPRRLPAMRSTTKAPAACAPSSRPAAGRRRPSGHGRSALL